MFVFVSVYDDLCEMAQSYSHRVSCPQAIIDLGFTCTCPIDPVHLVMNYHHRGSETSSLDTLLYIYPLQVMLNVLPGRFEVKEIPKGAEFLATVSIYHIPFTSFR